MKKKSKRQPLPIVGIVAFFIILVTASITAAQAQTRNGPFGVPQAVQPPVITAVSMTSDATGLLGNLSIALGNLFGGIGGNGNLSFAVPGDTVYVTVTADQAITRPSMTIAGRAATVTQGTAARLGSLGFNQNTNAQSWTGSTVMRESDTEGPVSFNVDPIANAAGTATTTTTISAVTQGGGVYFVIPIAPAYCVWNRQFSQNHTYQGKTYVLDSRCPPTSLVSLFTIAEQSGTQSATQTTQTTRKSRISTDTDSCLWGLCGSETSLDFDWSSTVSSKSGSLLPYINPGDTIKLTWACQPFQQLLWTQTSDSWVWGAFGSDDDLRSRYIAISNKAKGVGFTVPNGALRGSVTLQPTDSTTYQVTCVGSDTTGEGVVVNVDNPQGSITATPATISEGGSVTLAWSAKNVEDGSCSVSGPSGVIPGSEGLSKSPSSGVSSGSIFLFGQPPPATFTLTCSRYNGESVSWSASVDLNASACPADYAAGVPCSFKANPTEVLRGGDSTLTYFCQGGIGARYTIDASTNGGSKWTTLYNNQRLPTSAAPWTVKVNPLTNTIYRLTCNSGSTANTGGAQVTVDQPDLTSLKFKESGTSTYSPADGNGGTLTWNAKNVNPGSCQISGGTLTAPVLGNSNSGLALGPLTLLGTQKYTLTCQTPASQKSIETDPLLNPPRSVATLTVGSGVPPTFKIWSDVSRVRAGALFTLMWSTTPSGSVDAGSCALTDQDGNTVGTGENGSTETSITKPTTYTLTCTLNGEPVASQPFTMNLLPQYQEQ